MASIVTLHEIERMKKLYSYGMTGSQIGRILNRSKTCVTQKIRKNGGVLRDANHCGRRYSVNEKYFEKINSFEKAYWLGFIYADGCITKNGGSYKFSFGLWETDKYILEHLAHLLEFSGPIQKEKGCSDKAQNIYDLTIYGYEFCKHLIDKGVIERKTSKLSFPWWLPKEYWKYFLHGLFDGDGCITYSTTSKNAGKTGITYQCEFSGSRQMMLDVQTVLSSEYHIESRFVDIKNCNGKALFLNQTGTLKIFNLFYHNPPNFFMQRKYQRFKDLISLLKPFLYRKSELIQALILKSLDTIEENNAQNLIAN